jgi:glycosyltransferase involved in cell wall biosynthesis
MKALIAPAHFFLEKDYGSESAWACSIISGLSQKFDVEIDAVCGEGSFIQSNVRLFTVGNSKGGLYNRAFFAYRCYNLAKKLLDKADMVHHMFPFGFRTGFNSLATFGALRGKPFIIGPIEYPQEYLDITDFAWSYGRGGIWAELSYHTEATALGLSSKPLEQLQKSTLKEAEALVFDSEKALRLYKKQYAEILSGKIMKVIPPGVETEFFVNPALTRKSEFVILTVGYLLKRKGIQHLIKAMSTVVEESGDVKLKIVGDGPYKENLMRLTKELSLGNCVEFSGHMPRHELPKVYASCDLYVQPSLSETFPSTIREAMAAGKPIVATCVGVVGEYVHDGVNGCLVQPECPEALATKIIGLLQDESWRAKIGEAAKEYAEENFDWNKLSETWYKVYSCVI